MKLHELEKKTRNSYRTIKQLIDQFGKVRVVFDTYEPNRTGDYLLQGDKRRRIMWKNGKCMVSYKGQTYDKWTKYGVSCFTNGGTCTDFKHTMSRLKNHDKSYFKIVPAEVHYGWFFETK